jgi:hypothetical protein
MPIAGMTKESMLNEPDGVNRRQRSCFRKWGGEAWTTGFAAAVPLLECWRARHTW